MHHWVLSVEHLLDPSSQNALEEVSNQAVGRSLDAWRTQMAQHLTDGTLSELEHKCLSTFLQVLSNLRPYLVQCYDRKDFPRTNNEMERSIRRLKTQYRRISGRNNWNAYMLHYGCSVAYAAWWEQDADHQRLLSLHVARLDRTRWRELRHEAANAHNEQLKRFRFRHHRQAYLASLEQRWASAAPTSLLP